MRTVCVRPRELQEPPEQHVVKPIDPRDHVLERSRVLAADVLHGGRVVFHEPMAGVVDRLVVHRDEFAVSVGREERRGILYRGTFRQQVGEHAQTRIVDIGRDALREERQQLLRR